MNYVDIIAEYLTIINNPGSQSKHLKPTEKIFTQN